MALKASMSAGRSEGRDEVKDNPQRGQKGEPECKYYVGKECSEGQDQV